MKKIKLIIPKNSIQIKREYLEVIEKHNKLEEVSKELDKISEYVMSNYLKPIPEFKLKELYLKIQEASEMFLQDYVEDLEKNDELEDEMCK